MPINEQYRHVISDVASKKYNAGDWPGYDLELKQGEPILIRFKETGPSDSEINTACSNFIAAGGLAKRMTEMQRAEAIGGLTNPDGDKKLFRALSLVMLDEINSIRREMRLPQRTIEQLRGAITKKINDGTADN